MTECIPVHQVNLLNVTRCWFTFSPGPPRIPGGPLRPFSPFPPYRDRQELFTIQYKSCQGQVKKRIALQYMHFAKSTKCQLLYSLLNDQPRVIISTHVSGVQIFKW